MAIDANDVATILQAFNKTGGIPLTITTTATTEWTQFFITIVSVLISSIFIFIFMWDGYIRPIVGQIYLSFALRKLKGYTGRNVIIIKHTMAGLFNQAMISGDTLYKLAEAMNKFKGKPFDLVLHTPGGDIFYTQAIVRLLRSYGQPIRAIVPFYSMSGGTMLALSCNEIMISETAALGPIDPQLGGLFGYGSARSWKEVIRKKGRRASDSSVQFAYIGEQYTKTLRAMLREMLANKITDDTQMDAALDFFTSGTMEHGFPITHGQLSSLGIVTQRLPADIHKELSKIICHDWIEGIYYV